MKILQIVKKGDRFAELGENMDIANPSEEHAMSVSYTHLTLPTNREV